MSDELPIMTGRFLYHSNYYDGPRSGAMQADDGQRFWFDVHPDSDRAGEGYWYLLYDLTGDEWETETARHDLFREHVGTHCDYDENGSRVFVPGAVRPRSEHVKFYDHPELGSFRRKKPEFDYPAHHSPVAAWDPRSNRSTPPPSPEREETETQ